MQMNKDICTVRGEEELGVQVIIKIVPRYSLSDILTIGEHIKKIIFLRRCSEHKLNLFIQT